MKGRRCDSEMIFCGFGIPTLERLGNDCDIIVALEFATGHGSQVCSDIETGHLVTAVGEWFCGLTRPASDLENTALGWDVGKPEDVLDQSCGGPPAPRVIERRHCIKCLFQNVSTDRHRIPIPLIEHSKWDKVSGKRRSRIHSSPGLEARRELRVCQPHLPANRFLRG